MADQLLVEDAPVAGTSRKALPQGYDPLTKAYKRASLRKVTANADPLLEEWALNNVAWGLTASGIYLPLRVDANGQLQTSTAGSVVPAATVLQNAVGATGPGATLPVSGLTTGVFYVSGAFVATVAFEGTTVATNPQPADWFPVNAHQLGSTIIGNTASAPGIYRSSVAGLANVRARVSAWTSGAVTVTANAVAVDDTAKVSVTTLSGSSLILPVHDSAPNGYSASTDSIKTAIGRAPTTVVRATAAWTSWAIDMGEWKHVRIDIAVTGTTPSAVVQVWSAPRPFATYGLEPDANANKTVTTGIGYLVKDVGRFLKIQTSAVTGTSPSYEFYITPFN